MCVCVCVCVCVRLLVDVGERFHIIYPFIRMYIQFQFSFFLAKNSFTECLLLICMYSAYVHMYIHMYVRMYLPLCVVATLYLFSHLLHTYVHTVLCFPPLLQAKHLQFVGGVHISSFWLATFLWDLLNCLPPVILTIVLFAAFRVEEFSGPNLGILTLLLVRMYMSCVMCALCVLCVLYVLCVLCTVRTVYCVYCVLCVLCTVCTVCTVHCCMDNHVYFVSN